MTMAMLLGKKIGMTRIYDEAGRLVPVTVVLAGPCTVIQVKTVKTDGYNAVQMGFEDVKPSRRTKPLIGHSSKAGSAPKRFVREMRLPVDKAPECKVGDALTVATFDPKEWVDVISTGKGKGFQGVMKRHHFGGMPGSHGTERKHRSAGSIASHATNRGFSGRPKRGKRMAGRMGGKRVTTKNHPLVAVDAEKNLLAIQGTVAGAAGSYCIIRTAKTKAKKKAE
jgi:large subunit ribosomal protein L3